MIALYRFNHSPKGCDQAVKQTGIVEALFIRPTRETPLGLTTDTLQLQAGLGLTGDLHARSISPRQVLVVRSEDLTDFKIPAGALGENLLISGLDEQSFQPGALLTAGTAGIRLTMHCEPCKVIRHLVPSLVAIQKRRGLLGVVVKNGQIQAGDTISSEPDNYPALPEKPYLRFAQVLALIPAGQVITYTQLMVAMGVASSYARALPGYLPKARAAGLPVHRIVDTRGNLILAHVPEQEEKLTREGIRIYNGSIDLQRFGWDEPSLFLD